MGHFEQETRLRLHSDGHWQGALSDQWNIADNPNGGYMMAVAMRALSTCFPDHRQPLSVTTHYLRPGLAGEPCRVETEIIRRGRTMCTGRARLIQNHKIRLEIMAVFGFEGEGKLTEPPLTVAKPDIPDPEACIQRSGGEQGIELPILNRLDIRLPPEQVLAGAVGQAKISGWVRFADAQPVDCLALLMFVDTFVPSIFGLFGSVGWIPTVELTVHIKRPPSPGWILGEFETEDLQDGRIIENAALWDQSGHLVAQSRQLALFLKT